MTGIIPDAFKKLKDSYITTVYDCGDLDRLQREIVAEINKALPTLTTDIECRLWMYQKLLGTESEAKE